MTESVSRGRPRAFDEDAALAAIVQVFWSKGFAGTTYDALIKATGIGRQSLVYAFGDKREMFATALRAYETDVVGRIRAALDASPDGRSGVEAAFGLWRDAAITGKGCLMVSTAAAGDASDQEIAALVQRSRDGLVAAFARAFDRARKVGQLRGRASAADLGALAVACGDGCLIHAGKPGGARFAKQVLAAFLGAAFSDDDTQETCNDLASSR